MTTILRGTPINPGLFIGKARLIASPISQIPSRKISQKEIGAEIQALQTALNTIEAEINELLDSEGISDAETDILQAHLMILRDPELEKDLLFGIETELLSAAATVHKVFSRVCQQFREMDNDYFAQRVADYKDVSQRIIACLIGQDRSLPASFAPDEIAIVEELSPSRISSLVKAGLKAYISQTGSVNSHAGILSRALGLISVSAVPGLMDTVSNGTEIILDAVSGEIFLAPDPALISRYTRMISKAVADEQREAELSDLPAITTTGERITLLANIEIPEELSTILAVKADGIGLFRTEFLYLERQNLPSEDEQYRIYHEIISRMSPRPVTIRTFDLGGDKISGNTGSLPEENPYLGNRGFRFSMSRPDIFRTQLRAILRASLAGKARIMFPMIIDAEDFLRAKALVLEAMRELDSAGIGYDPEIMLGSMIEVPSAALCAAELASVCDFLSIGTNDLVQYTLATDRNNDSVSTYYVEHHPAVLKLLRMVIHASAEHGKPLSVCGEMASNPRYIPLLIGLGITALSVNPHQLRQIRNLIRAYDTGSGAIFGDPARAWTSLELKEAIDELYSRYNR